MTDPSPLLLTDDELLRADVVRLAAAAGVVLEVAREGADALRAWTRAPLVLVGADRVADMAGLRPPRREGVHVIGRGPLGDLLFREALGVGAETVAELPRSETWLVELLTDVGDGAGVTGVCVAVLGGSGGAGATTFAAALGHAFAAGAPALVVDADLMGPGIDRVLGMERAPGVRWDALTQATGRLSARSLRDTLPRRERLSVLAWPAERPRSLPTFAMREVLSAGSRGFGAVVVDLARFPDPVGEEVLARADHVVLVSRLTVPGIASATRAVRRLPAAVPRSLVTRGPSSGVRPDEVARLLKLPLAVAMADQRGLDEMVGLGAGPSHRSRGALSRAARTVVDGVLRAPRSVA